MDTSKPSVFLSCGQNKQSNERTVAAEIKSRIEKLGFNCYVAVEQQSLKSLRENIFYHLDHADYFVFVDFKREEIASEATTTGTFRGSLFANQELAIASFLDIPTVVFQEEGLRERDGMLSAFQANATPFTDRINLPAIISRRIEDLLET